LAAYGVAEFQAGVLRAYGMQPLQEAPVLDRRAIEDRLPPLLQSQLAHQLEMIKITPVPMGTEELSKLWAALQSPYRPTAAYQASVVLIDSPGVSRAAQPVLTRGAVDQLSKRESGALAQADLVPALPGLIAVRPPNRQPGA